jgi:hypothetical protein
MNRPRLVAVLLLAALLSVPGYWALAGDEKKPANPAGSAAKPVERDQTRAERTDARPSGKPPALLGKTLKLEFKLANPQEEPTFEVLCATDEFAISRKVSDTNGAQGIEIAGTLTKLDEQGRLLLSFKAEVQHMDSNNGVEARFTAKGSAILDVGKSKTLTVLGESPLKVTATAAD